LGRQAGRKRNTVVESNGKEKKEKKKKRHRVARGSKFGGRSKTCWGGDNKPVSQIHNRGGQENRGVRRKRQHSKCTRVGVLRKRKQLPEKKG